jgi:hypothetical protein
VKGHQRSGFTAVKARRCLWLGCNYNLERGSTPDRMYCYAHQQALGPELAERLRKAYGTDDWMAALDACQAHAKSTREFVKTKVRGG